MPEPVAIAIAQTERIPVKPSINPDAFYTYQELEELKFGKYLKFRRAIKAGRLQAHYAGRNILIAGSDLISYLKGGK